MIIKSTIKSGERRWPPEWRPLTPTFLWVYLNNKTSVSVQHHFIQKVHRQPIFRLVGKEEEAMDFVNMLNSNNWGIKFTPKFSTTEI